MEPTLQPVPPAPAPRLPRWVPWVIGAMAAVVVAVVLAAATLVAAGDDDADADARLVPDAGAVIAPAAAGDAAVDAVGGGRTVVEVDLDDEGGVLVYEVELRDPSTLAETDVVVDARSGAVLALTD